jgi:two-component system, cell cycle response regulator DivK
MNPTIAIVEDSPDNRLLLQAFLSDDYELTEYEDGSAAMEGLKQSPPNLVLLDISLPGIDGIEVLARIRADEKLRSLRVIALTAHAMAGDKERLLKVGFDAYVAKPIVDENVLRCAIESQLIGNPEAAGVTS